MSTPDAGRFTDVATLGNLKERAFPAGQDDAAAPDELDDDARESALAGGTWTSRPVSPARDAASRNTHIGPFIDPSNYLG